MSAKAEDLRDFYSAVPGVTYRVRASTPAATAVPEALPEGRYWVRLVKPSDPAGGQEVWIRFSADGADAATLTEPGPQNADAIAAGILLLETLPYPDATEQPSFYVNVRKGVNDRFSARTGTGQCSVWLTKMD